MYEPKDLSKEPLHPLDLIHELVGCVRCIMEYDEAMDALASIPVDTSVTVADLVTSALNLVAAWNTQNPEAPL